MQDAEGRNKQNEKRQAMFIGFGWQKMKLQFSAIYLAAISGRNKNHGDNFVVEECVVGLHCGGGGWVIDLGQRQLLLETHLDCLVFCFLF